MNARSIYKQLILACALVSAACGADPKSSKSGENDDAGNGDEMDGAVPGAVYDDAGNLIGVLDDAGNLVDDAGNVVGSIDDAGNVVLSDAGVAEDRDAGYLFADGEAPYPVNPAGQVLCNGTPCKCSDGLDNDEPADGLIDLADPECSAAWDNDETSLATGISGDNRDYACQDCFFDGNSGSGNDGCALPSSCFTTGMAPASGQGNSCDTCEQPAKCVNFCKKFAPNGCDCFGCCEVHVNGTVKHLQIGTQCSVNADGTTSGAGCAECVPNDSCINECGECELCAGKTLADLPAKCFQTTIPDGGTTPVGDGGSTPAGDGGSSSGDGGTVTPPPPAYVCESGEQVCGQGLPACPAGDICSFGCCTRSPIILQ